MKKRTELLPSAVYPDLLHREQVYFMVFKNVFLSVSNTTNLTILIF